MKCPSCDTDGLTGIYCSNCGARLTPTDEVNNSNSETSEKNISIENEAYVIDKSGYLQKREVGLTAKKIYIFFGIIAVIILISIINNTNQNAVKKTNSPETNKTQAVQKENPEELYNKGQDQFKQGNYKEAEQTFKSLLNKYPNSNISTDAKKMLDSSVIELDKKKNKLLENTTSIYDEMDDVTIIVPKGYSTKYINTNKNINISPEIRVTKFGLANLIITVGFDQNDWIFTDRVIFKADEEKFEWVIDSLKDRQSQVFMGGIAEWIRKISSLDKDLINQMEKLANAKDAKIRFQGQGYRDHVVRDDEKANLLLFLELYKCYQ